MPPGPLRRCAPRSAARGRRTCRLACRAADLAKALTQLIAPKVRDHLGDQTEEDQ